MKTIIITIIFFWSSVVLAQIPNGGFETWSVDNNGPYPEGWWVSSQIWPGSNVVNCEMITDHTEGQYALKLSSHYSSVYQAVIPGWAFLMGFPVSNKPQSLYWDYKYQKFGNDPGGVIRVYLTEYDSISQTSNIISDQLRIFNVNKSEWTPYVMNLSYNPNKEPDSCYILIACSDDEYAVDSTWLIIDNFLFDTYIAVEEINENPFSISVFPNPATDIINIEIGNTKPGNINYSVLGITGQTMKKGVFQSDEGISSFRLSLADLQAGIYFLRIQSQEYDVVKEIIVR